MNAKSAQVASLRTASVLSWVGGAGIRVAGPLRNGLRPIPSAGAGRSSLPDVRLGAIRGSGHPRVTALSRRVQRPVRRRGRFRLAALATTEVGGGALPGDPAVPARVLVRIRPAVRPRARRRSDRVPPRRLARVEAPRVALVGPTPHTSPRNQRRHVGGRYCESPRGAMGSFLRPIPTALLGVTVAVEAVAVVLAWSLEPAYDTFAWATVVDRHCGDGSARCVGATTQPHRLALDRLGAPDGGDGRPRPGVRAARGAAGLAVG